MGLAPGCLLHHQALVIDIFFAQCRLLWHLPGLHQQLRRTRQRQARRTAASGVQALGQSPDRAGGHQIAGGVIQRLHRQRQRFIRLFPGHAGLGNPAAHLHQAVKATTITPWAAPAVGVEADVDQSGGDVLTFAKGITELLQGIGAVTVEQDVGVLEQRFEHLPVVVAR